ncbi:MAG TPA: hypothetical protein VIR33_13300 [Thermopolyspora sp.]
MARPISRGVLTVIVIVAVLGAGIYAGIYYLIQRAKPFAQGEHCAISTPDGSRELDIEQAQTAATIAAVAARRRLSERAVQIAYVTAIQESKLLNLPYGDLDSVGVFQQRPSQGWGSRKQLLDPVYATKKFFSTLEKVQGYRTLPLHVAAQEVQRSADGSAYAMHEQDAKILAAAFTGRVPKGVHCWYPPTDKPVASRPDAARRQLVRALGSAPAIGNQISAPTTRRGWLIASWSVAHAQRYGLHEVRYAGVVWSADDGHDGWRSDTKALAGRVEVS